jgi:hypothetical protein
MEMAAAFIQIVDKLLKIVFNLAAVQKLVTPLGVKFAERFKIAVFILYIGFDQF